MTAEIVIMNKTAVAMAADSVVSVGQTKEYQSASKLFALRPDLPVGIMIYNAAEFALTPWEVVIKEYRRWHPRGELSTIDEYVDSFLTFVASCTDVIPEATRVKAVQGEIGGYLRYIRDQLDAAVHDQMTAGPGVTEGWVRRRFDTLLGDSVRQLESTPKLKAHLPGYEDEIAALVDELAPPIIEAAFQTLLTDRRRNRLAKIARLLLTHECGRGHYSGIVMAGYGSQQLLPAVHECITHLITPKNVAYVEGTQLALTPDVESTIFPCAQRATVDAFVTGIDPRLEDELNRSLDILFGQFTERLVDRVQQDFTSPLPNAMETLASDFQAAAEEVINGLRDGLAERSAARWQQPVIRAVSALPKDELANMAEALVNITSLRQRVSLTRETVGGPIDVCVISRSDGLVWINRKHYFRPELNPQFLARYQCVIPQNDGGVADAEE